MKPILALFLSIAAAAAWAQPAQPGADTVIATLEDGAKVTYGQMQIFLSTLPPETQQAAMRDRKTFVSQYALMRKLSRMAEQNGLHEASPTREMIEFQRMQALTTAQVNSAMDQIRVPAADIEKYYQDNKDRYTQARVKAIYVSFVGNPALAGGEGKALTESQARIKVEKLLKEIRGGADFVKLAKVHSEDRTSAEKDGDFGVIRRGDSLPDAVRTAIFALKQGEVSEPVRQPNGYYLFRADQVTSQPFDQVRDDIFNHLKQERFRQWMEEMQASIKVQFAEEPSR
jgi:peptidyl-prolyl cis-trans isomerase C